MSEEPPSCTRCKIPMKEGKALVPTPETHHDLGGEGDTVSMTGRAELVQCWKCPECGESTL